MPLKINIMFSCYQLIKLFECSTTACHKDIKRYYNNNILHAKPTLKTYLWSSYRPLANFNKIKANEITKTTNKTIKNK